MEITEAYRDFTHLFSQVLKDLTLVDSLKPELNAAWSRMTEEQQHYIEQIVAEAVARSKAKAQGEEG